MIFWSLVYFDQEMYILKSELTFSCLYSRTMDTQWRHKSEISEKLGRCGRQNMLPPYLKIWDWDWIFGRAVKAISFLGVRSPWSVVYCIYSNLYVKVLFLMKIVFRITRRPCLTVLLVILVILFIFGLVILWAGPLAKSLIPSPVLHCLETFC